MQRSLPRRRPGRVASGGEGRQEDAARQQGWFEQLAEAMQHERADATAAAGGVPAPATLDIDEGGWKP